MISPIVIVTMAMLASQAQSLSHPLASRIPPPHYDQCDPRWGNDVIGLPDVPPSEDSSICRVGCAMSSLASLLASFNTTSTWLKGEQAAVTPGTLNKWLALNGGYDCVNIGTNQSKDTVCFDLFSFAIQNLTGKVEFDGYVSTPPSLVTMKTTLDTVGYVVHVDDGHHFVLVTEVDVDAGILYVMDPGFNRTQYPYSAVSGALVYPIRSSIVPVQYPTFKQCDPKWGDNLMVNTTVCRVGCLMSSTSMALAGHGIDVDGVPATPGSLNAWLRTHSGYDNDNDFDESVLPKVSSLLPPGTVSWPKDGHRSTNDISVDELITFLRSRVIIANVMHGGHFVLVVGVDSDRDTLIVNDPGFNRTTYSYTNDVVGWRIFDMK
eukprot:m.190851 g.190851  ORF g.190851 m.190851 type:complete len:377 (+) comp32415_c3_seq2:181-1311(+)